MSKFTFDTTIEVSVTAERNKDDGAIDILNVEVLGPTYRYRDIKSFMGREAISDLEKEAEEQEGE